MTLASEIARFLERPLLGEDVDIVGPASLSSCGSGHLVFAKSLSEESLAALSNPDVVALIPPSFPELPCRRIAVDNPRLAFARALHKFFHPGFSPGVARTAVVGMRVTIGAGVRIGEYSVIGDGVVIGADTEIRNHVSISPKTVIGDRCLVRSGAVIGEEGFGFELDEFGRPVRLPHLGGVRIGADCEIGASTVIARGTLDDTCIGNRVKIDDQVFIAHNVRIGDDSLVIAGAEISGSVRLGAQTWIGPNACILNGIVVGEGAFVGIGAVVTKDVPSRTSVAGNPARSLSRKPIDV